VIAALWGLLACSPGSAPTAPTPRARPSVLLITLDTTRADRLGPYGHPLAETPAYDALAAAGTLFARAYSVCPLTIPAHSSLFTGRYPPSHGVRDNGDFVLGPEAVTLAERFRDAGYRTAAFTAAFPTQSRWGFDQGFDTYHDPLERLPTQLDWRDERPADAVVDDALETLAGVEGPVFAWVHLFDAHWPYEPPEPFKSRHAGRPYDGEIAFAADQVGRLMAAWDAAYPDSVVLVTADHGEGLGDGGEQTHGFLLHDGTLRIPMLLRGPGVPAGQRIPAPVSQVDVAPTLLELAGLAVHEGVEGQSLVGKLGSRQLYSEALTGQFNLGLAPLHALTGDVGRYTRGGWGGWYGLDGPRVLTAPDLSRDASAEDAALTALLAAAQPPDAVPNALDADTLARLQALGYVGGDPLAEAGEVDPRDVIDLVPLTWRVRQALGRGQLDVAEQALVKLETRLAGTFGVDLLRAQQLRALGRRGDAVEALAQLYLRSPGGTLALQLGDLYATAGSWAEARDWYIEALEHNPMSPEAMAGQVRAALALGELIEAEALAERFLAVYPDHAELALVRAELILSAGRTDEALEEAAYALRRMPRSPHALAVHARTLWAAGQADPALARLGEALRLDPTALDHRLLRVEWLLEVGRNAEASRAIAPAARLLPEDAAVRALSRRAEEALAEELGR